MMEEETSVKGYKETIKRDVVVIGYARQTLREPTAQPDYILDRE